MANSTLSTIGVLMVLLTVTADWSETQGWSLSRFGSVYRGSDHLFRGRC